MNWKRFILLISSCVALMAGVVIACDDFADPYDEYASFFLNNISNEPAYRPFYLYKFNPFYEADRCYEDESDRAVTDQNIEAWYSYTDKKVVRKDIAAFVYEYPLNNVILHSAANLEMPQELRNNGFARWLVAKDDREAFNYLVFAKECERTIPQDDYMDFNIAPRAGPALARLEERSIEAANTCHNHFIKDRYKYQALRMAFHDNRNNAVLQLYRELFGDKTPNSVIGYRCLGMKAGALFRLGKPNEAAHLYSIVFEHSDELKQSAYISFQWCTGTNVDSALLFCNNKHERAVMYMMTGLYEQKGQERAGLKALGKAYANDPNVTGLEVVMTREMNKAEERYLAADFAHLPASYGKYHQNEETLERERKAAKERQAVMRKQKKEYTAYLLQLSHFAQRVAAARKNSHTAYWLLASAYTSYMTGDANNCSQYLALAEREKLTEKEHDVYSVVKMLSIISAQENISSAGEAELLPALRWMEESAGRKPQLIKVYYDFMQSALASAYLNQGDTIRAAYCLSRHCLNDRSYCVYDGDTIYHQNDYPDGDFTSPAGTLLEHMNTKQLERVQAFLQNPAKTPFEQWLIKNTVYTTGVVRELEGTKFIRLHQFAKAAEVLQQVPRHTLNKRLLPDIFADDNGISRQRWNKVDSAHTYNKLSLAEAMVKLERRLACNPKDGRAAYQYANALYSITFYGKASHAKKYFRGSFDQYAHTSERLKLTTIQQEYYNARLPEQYYMLAFENTTDVEQKAKCLFMAAKCWQKYYFDERSKEYLWWKSTPANPYFKRLKDNYSKTALFATAKSTCSYFGDYLTRK